MKNVLRKQTKIFSHAESGSAIVVALLILTLLTAFVALAVMRTTNETIATSNDAAESKAFAAAQASLEIMTRNFDKIFEEKLSPAPADLQHVEDLKPPVFENEYDFSQQIVQTKATQTVVMSGQLLQGLNALRDEWQVDTTATEKSSGVQVALRRQFYNNRIPIFQFGIFYNDDLEFHPGPRFDFGGRVHSNGNLFLMAQTGLYFSSRVSAVGEVLTDVARNGRPYTDWGQNVFIKNGSGTYVQLRSNMGSVLKNPVNGSPVFSANSDMPVVYNSSNWNSNSGLFQGNLLARQKPLELPLVIASRINGNALDYIELIKRGKNLGDLYNNGASVTAVNASAEDTIITSKERYANKKGIRISLADSKAKLPGCAAGIGTNAVSTACGVRLDGASNAPASGNWGNSDADGSRGYQPKTMRDGYQATRINGERLAAGGNQVWIKIELVGINPSTNTVETQDVTEDILSLGVTQQAPFSISGYGTKDSRSIIKLQRFSVPAVALTASDTNYATFVSGLGGSNHNIVLVADRPTNNGTPTGSGAWTARDNGFTDNAAHYKTIPAPASGSGTERRIVPFPIEIFDTREGLYNDSLSNLSTLYPSGNVPLAGVMSLVDIDIANLRNFLNGSYNAQMPNTGTVFSQAKGRELRHTDVPESNGWVLYVSDRRGDADFDGEYDMEDIYGNNDGILQPGEDVNNNNRLDTDFLSEAVRYTGAGNHTSPALAATVDHRAYRRGVRLINGQTLPGVYDPANSLNTKGFTVASENGIYIKGNYNATGIVSAGSPTPSNEYLPQNTANHIPASVVADAITILSNNWEDARSFRYPFSLSSRPATETTIRFAMLAGDARSSYENTPNQGGGDPRLTGGVHNFKRFLEDWSGNRLNYAGSLINLFNSRNNNGAFKCCTNVYSPPTRNWVFDATFLDPTRLPPGTPFFQNIQLTGFQRVN